MQQRWGRGCEKDREIRNRAPSYAKSICKPTREKILQVSTGCEVGAGSTTQRDVQGITLGAGTQDLLLEIPLS